MDITKAYEIYNKMIQIRLIEEAIVVEYPSQEIRTPVHLCLGQEAIAAAVSVNLDTSDFIVSNHRSHGHCLAKGMDMAAFFKELYGKAGGVSSGWGGSMHLCDLSLGIVGTSAIVAGGIPIGVGVALKQKIKGEPSITVIYFGDGAVDEGIFWESLNFCRLKELPVLFVMENNKYASQTSVDDRHAYQDIGNIVSQFGIPSHKVDGNDAVQVYCTVNDLIRGIREETGPAFVECTTYRWMGHVGPVDDTDTGYRTREEMNYWLNRCPVAGMERYLRENDSQNAEGKLCVIKNEWQKRIAIAIKAAKEAPYAMD